MGALREAGFEPVVEHTGRFVGLLRALTPREAASRVPGMDWTAAEVGAHVLSVYRRYTVDRQRAPDLAALAAQNAAGVEAFGTDLDAISAGIEEQVALLASVAASIDPEQEFPFHVGLSVTARAGWANLIAELLVHGDDIARATGRHWTVPAHDLEGIWRDLLPVASGWFRPGAAAVDERYELRFAFGPVHVHLDRGRVVCGNATVPPDHVVTVGDAVECTLAFPYRRRLISDPALALLASRFYDI